jgi:hypothetical protein
MGVLLAASSTDNRKSELAADEFMAWIARMLSPTSNL